MIRIFERVKPVIAYHGTTDKFLREILKKGMVPNPKKRAWDEDPQAGISQISRASLYGTYWATSVITAVSSARNTTKKFGGDRIIVIASLVPESGVADEDSITGTFKRVVSTALRDIASINDIEGSMWMGLFWGEYKADSNMLGSVIEEVGRNLNEEFAKTPGKKPIPYDIVAKAILSFLKRQTMYAYDNDKYGWIEGFRRAYSYATGERYEEDVPSPQEMFGIDKKEAESYFKEAQDELTRYYREVASSGIRDSGPLGGTLRILEPVTYSGRNRIIGIVRIHTVQVESEFTPGKTIGLDALEVVYGEVPRKFYDDWEDRVGEIRWAEDYQ